jgi:adenine specific DNA methylase mod
LEKNGFLYFGKSQDNVPRIKIFENLEKEFYLNSILRGFGTSSSAKDELLNILKNRKIFDTPKPVKLVKELIRATTLKNNFILDFFSGSATTAHAVMELNVEDSGDRKYIMVQLPEKTTETSDAYKARYKNICEIGKERIRRASKKLKEENPNSNFDDGFRVLRIDSSNMKDVYYKPEEFIQENLKMFESNIKEDRSGEDLLFQVMLDLGIELSNKIEEKFIQNNKIYDVGENFLIACFDENITEEVVTEIAKLKPFFAIFKEGNNLTDNTLINFEEIFKTYSPDTKRRVL